MESPRKEDHAEISVIIFRLNSEWLALDTAFFCEILPEHKIHSIPHRSNEVFKGVADFHGQLTLCVDMHHFLNVAKESDGTARSSQKRMIALQYEAERWLFAADEIFGEFRCRPASLQNIPAAILKAKKNYLRAIFTWEGKDVGYLDGELVFYGLKRSIV